MSRPAQLTAQRLQPVPVKVLTRETQGGARTPHDDTQVVKGFSIAPTHADDRIIALDLS